MRNKFDQQLTALNRKLTQMGAMCEEAISLAAKALTTGNQTAARQVSEVEADIDRQEREIENLCLKMLLQQQPVARDLRQISAALKMITDMERIGDQASDIAEIILSLDRSSAEECAPIAKMAEETMKMVTESVDAYVKQDTELAKATIIHDDLVDSCFNEVKKSLIGITAEHLDDGEYILDLLMIAKYFERIGDHAVNIAEWVLFSVTGIHKGEEL